jgi:hypothetical protein
MDRESGGKDDTAGQRCPFYSYRWPPKGNELFPGARGECGLDVDKGTLCQMEQSGQPPDYDRCPLVRQKKPFLDAFLKKIRFQAPAGGSKTYTLDERLEAIRRNNP